MIGALAYYLLLYPLSLLPLWILYIISDFFFLLLITVFPYRRKVIRENIKNSFPDKSKKERKAIERKFYRHFADLLAEVVKNLSISETELTSRFTIENKEILDKFYDKGKSVLLVSGHYNNWEWLILGQNLFFQHQAVGIGMPLTSGFWNKKLNERRARFGMKIIHSKTVYDFFDKNKEVVATLVLADQSPGDSKKCYWTNFLNQQTGFVFGPELLANKYDHAVVFFQINKVKRGHYSMYLEEITDEPKALNYGEITERFTALLENTILEAPSSWLWSHKRWKRSVPPNLEELNKQHRQDFEQRFR